MWTILHPCVISHVPLLTAVYNEHFVVTNYFERGALFNQI